jgi:hypothetical protein
MPRVVTPSFSVPILSKGGLRVNPFVREFVMPSVSQNQAIAMRLAAAGKSNLGIPKKVGKDFVRADKGRDIKKLPKRVRNNHGIGG